LSKGAGGTGIPPVLLGGYVDAFGLLFQGKSLSGVQRHQTDVAVPPPDFRAGLLLSIVAGLVVFPVVVAALPEGAAIAALTTAFGGTALAGIAAGVIVTACAGVLAGVSAVVAQRFVLALTNDLPWDEVLDEEVLARDAVLGGMLNAATFGVGQAISKVRLAIRATKDAKKLSTLQAEVTALEETQARLAAEQDRLRKAPNLRVVSGPQPAGVVNGTGGTHNCVSCAIAGDLTLAGTPASAINLYPGVAIPNGLPAIATYARTSWRVVSGRAAIEAELKAAGDGARGIVYGIRADGTAHVFNAVVQKGVVNFVDFQKGGAGSFSGFTRFAFIRTG
jgi:Papain fold toxin 1, glutamine deamidase